jgi:hypothetical protein
VSPRHDTEKDREECKLYSRFEHFFSTQLLDINHIPNIVFHCISASVEVQKIVQDPDILTNTAHNNASRISFTQASKAIASGNDCILWNHQF